MSDKQQLDPAVKEAVYAAISRYGTFANVPGADAAILQAWLSTNFNYVEQRRLLDAIVARLMRLARRRPDYLKVALRLRDIGRVLTAIAQAKIFLHGVSLEEFIGVVDSLSPALPETDDATERVFYRALFELHKADAALFDEFKKSRRLKP